MWRQRMDVTANWAVPLLLGLATFALGDPAFPHALFLFLGGVLIVSAITIEVRRYRELHHAMWRAHLVEAGWFAGQLARSELDPRWRAALASDLRRPRPSLPIATAILARMRRTYLVLVYVLVATWMSKVALHPRAATSGAEVLDRLRLGPIPGAWFAGAVVVALAILTALTVTSPRLAELETSAYRPARDDTSEERATRRRRGGRRP
jgi:uncharacterized membrane protein